MARRYYSTTAVATTLTGSISNATTSIPVAATTGFPGSTPYTLLLDEGTASEEVVTVTGVAGLNLTVTRGVDGTSAVSHNSGATVKHGVSARDFDEPNAFINGTGVVTTGHLADSSVTNAKLANSSITVNGSAVSLGGSVTIAGESFNPFFLTF